MSSVEIGIKKIHYGSFTPSSQRDPALGNPTTLTGICRLKDVQLRNSFVVKRTGYKLVFNQSFFEKSLKLLFLQY